MRFFPNIWFSVAFFVCSFSVEAREPDRVFDIWPGMAPGETTQNTGETLPRRSGEDPPATRVGSITKPRLQMFEPPTGKKSGACVLIFPGGGYNYVVTDKEGSEAAQWLNTLGITAFVVHYRTKPKTPAGDAPMWLRPVQDGQRAVRLVRSRAKEWGLKPDQIGVLGFSAGGQAAALVGTRFSQQDYEAQDDVDALSARPDFCMLVYPWRISDEKTGELVDAVTVGKETPPTLLIHAHNDSATSLGSIAYYIALRKLRIPCELHIYESGGHGYGMRPVKGSQVDSWPDRAADWLKQLDLARAQ